MTDSDAVVVFGLLGAMILTSLAAGLVGGLIWSVRGRNRLHLGAGVAGSARHQAAATSSAHDSFVLKSGNDAGCRW